MPSDDEVLREFVARHARPYDPKMDTYDRPPFTADIKEGKNNPIYNAHSYHTKVPPRGIIPYILHYTEPGDLILDPFCGSGMAGVAALMCADPPADILEQFPELKDRVGPRRAILNDLSPAACHIAYNYSTPVDVEELCREFERIAAAVTEEFNCLYGTEHYEPGVGLYDPRQPEVAERLKNPAPQAADSVLFKTDVARTWELASRDEIEKRLGYPVTALPRGKDWAELDTSTVDRWIVIPATIQYMIWSDVYRCHGFVTIEEPTGKLSTRGKNAGKRIVKRRSIERGCGTDLVLWRVARDPQDNDLASEFSCPDCGAAWTKRQLALSSSLPVHTSYSFQGLTGERRIERAVTKKETENQETIDRTAIPSWFPDDPIDIGREMMRHGLLKRGLRRASEFYTTRNLRALARLWHEISLCQSERTREFLRFCFTSILSYVSKKQSYGGGGGGLTSTLYIAAFQMEKNVWEVFARKVEGIGDDFSRSGGYLGNGTLVPVRCGSATTIPVPDGTVDFVFTDPPFGSNIFYSDCSMLWESWLGTYTEESSEIVVSDRRKDGPFKTLADYAALMAQAFSEIHRVLKPGRWATIEFNNSDGAVFSAIKDAIRSAGFEIANMLLLDKKQKSFKQLKGASGEEDVVDKDVIFNLRKPSRAVAAFSAAHYDLEHQMVGVVREHLRTLPERIKAEPDKYSDDYRTTATLNSVLINALLPKGVGVEDMNIPLIEKVCGRYFRKVGQRWYLRGEPVGADGKCLFEEAVIVRDEESAIRWLRQWLRAAPTLIGELRPHWMRATGLLQREISEVLVLEDLLAENFWCDAGTNRWREPTDDERERMNDDRALRVLHDAERFLGGVLKRHPADAERAGWIDTLYRAAAEMSSSASAIVSYRRIDPAMAYKIVVRLFQGLLPEGLDGKLLSRAQKQAEVASRQLKKLTAPEGNPARALKNLPLFDGAGGEPQ